MKMFSLLLTITTLCLTHGARAESQTLDFGGKKYTLASAVVGKDGSLTNEYVPEGETLQSWTTLVAGRQWPKAEKVGDAAAPWLKMIRPLLTKKVEVFKSEGAKGDDILFEAWLSAPDRSYIEINLHRFVKEEGSEGVKAYQYAQKVVMKDGKGDPSTFLENRTKRFNELAKLKLTAHQKK
jgi:hypothetical protein